MAYEKKMRYFLISKGCSQLSLAEKSDYDVAGQDVRAGFSGRMTLKEAKARFKAGTLAPDFVHDEKLEARLAHVDDAPKPADPIKPTPATCEEREAVKAAAERIQADKMNGAKIEFKTGNVTPEVADSQIEAYKAANSRDRLCDYCQHPIEGTSHTNPETWKEYHPECILKFYAERAVEKKESGPSRVDLAAEAFNKGHKAGYKQALTEMSGKLQSQADALEELIATL